MKNDIYSKMLQKMVDQLEDLGVEINSSLKQDAVIKAAYVTLASIGWYTEYKCRMLCYEALVRLHLEFYTFIQEKWALPVEPAFNCPLLIALEKLLVS